MIIVLFGQPNSGKTTLANKLMELNRFKNTTKHLDGDLLREMFNNKDFSKEGRLRNLQKASDLAHEINNKDIDVILSLVYPYKEARDYLHLPWMNVKWIYLTYDTPRGREAYHVNEFDEPTENFIRLNTDQLSIDECIEHIMQYI